MTKEKYITLAHGSGGAVMHSLIKEQILRYFTYHTSEIDVGLEELDDSAVIGDIAFTTDTYTVQPIFFPGGNIGSLAVAGTINDVSVIGAKPIAISSGFVFEEGFRIENLSKILKSMHEICLKSGVPIITGDTKVVEKGGLTELVINTSGIGIRTPLLNNNIAVVKKFRKFDENWLKDSNLSSGDKIICSGTVGDHGVALLSYREGYGFECDIKSDICPLNKLISKLLAEGGIVAMKDPTRGGLANALNEWSEKSNVGIIIDEKKIPIREEVRSACELLGIDPLEIGNEGKIIIGVVNEKADDILQRLHETSEGKNAEVIGECTTSVKGVVLRTSVGGKRIVEQPVGDPIPRIC